MKGTKSSDINDVFMEMVYRVLPRDRADSVRALMADRSTNESLRSRMVFLHDIGIITSEELLAIGKVAKSGIRHVEKSSPISHPWAKESTATLTALGWHANEPYSREREDQVVAELVRARPLESSVLATRKESLGALYCWIHSKKRLLLKLDPTSSDRFEVVLKDREKLGSGALDWRERPMPSSALFGQGIMIQWSPQLFTFGMLWEDYFRAMVWKKATDEEFEASGTSWFTTSFSLDKLTESALENLAKIKYWPIEHNAGFSREHKVWIEIVQSTFNVLAAINTSPVFEIFKPIRTEHRGKASVGNMRNVQVLVPDLAELDRWAAYYTNLKPRVE